MPAYTESDLRYFREREELLKRYPSPNLWFPIDNWPLFAGVMNIARFLSIYELIKKVIYLPGHLCELGCWNGTNLVFMAKVFQILRSKDYTKVFGFDSFEGLEEFGGADISVDTKTDYNYGGDLLRLRDILKLYSLDDSVNIINGDILKTLPEFLEEKKDIRFSFIYFDADLYAPTKLGIELLWPKLLSGGIMVFDEYNDVDFPGETTAVHEVLGESVELFSVPNTRQPTAYLVKE